MSFSTDMTDETERFPAAVVQGRTIGVGKTRWAIDIEWTRELPGTTVAKARAGALALGADLYVTNGSTQYGTSKSALGHSANMPSLALAMVEQADGSNLIGGFPCDNGQFYVVAVVKGQIWPDHDNVYEEDEARGLLRDFVERVGFDTVYAPQTWLLEKSRDTSLGEILQAARPRRHRLQGTSRRGTYARLAAAAAIIALAYVGYDFYSDYQLQELVREGQREAAEAEAQRQRDERLNAIVYPPMPSIAMGRGMDTLRTCVRFMDQVPQHNPGWVASKLDCDGGSVTLTMRQNGVGTVNWLYPYIGQHDGALLDTPLEKLATATWRLDPTRIPAWGDVKGQAPALVSRYLNSQFQEVYQPFTLGAPQRPDIQTTTVGRRPVTTPAPWTTSALEITQKGYLRSDVFDVVDRIQNLVLESVSESLPDRTWTVRATIYHALPPPDGSTAASMRR